jgi:hypothetical protein
LLLTDLHPGVKQGLLRDRTTSPFQTLERLFGQDELSLRGSQVEPQDSSCGLATSART